MQNNDNDNFAYIHVRPGLESKEHPVATIAISTVPEDGYGVPQRFAVGFAAQHVKKDRMWNAEMGRNVARGRAEKSAKRVFVYADNHSRRDLLMAAVMRVLESVESGETFATKKVTRALQDTLARLYDAKLNSEVRFDLQAAE